jgi:UDP-N-acetylmuramate dehydrogenase
VLAPVVPDARDAIGSPEHRATNWIPGPACGRGHPGMTVAALTSGLASDLSRQLPKLRGRLAAGQTLAPFTWFRVGGPAEVLFSPADEEDLAYFCANLPSDVPVTTVGLGSNLIVRDGGVPGVVVRLGGRAFGEVAAEDGYRLRTGAAVPDMKLARVAADAGIDGLAFYRGIPGAIGGALRMNAGAHGGETKDVLIEVRGIDRQGNLRRFANAEMGYTYRHSDAPEEVIFTQAWFQGRVGDPARILAEMECITAAREASQPIREKTGGSTFKNPPGRKAWQLIDEAGCRGLTIGGAQVSEMHCNFLINRGTASAADIENLAEEVRRRVRETSGVALEWEIRRIGVAGAPSRAEK